MTLPELYTTLLAPLQQFNRFYFGFVLGGAVTITFVARALWVAMCMDVRPRRRKGAKW